MNKLFWIIFSTAIFFGKLVHAETYTTNPSISYINEKIIIPIVTYEGIRPSIYILDKDFNLSRVEFPNEDSNVNYELFFSKDEISKIHILSGISKSGSSSITTKCSISTFDTNVLYFTILSEFDISKCASELEKLEDRFDYQKSYSWMARANAEQLIINGLKYKRASSSNLIEIYKNDTLIANLTIYTDGAVISTSEGYFDFVGNNVHNRIKFKAEGVLLNLDNVFDIFHRPDLVKLKLKGRDISEFAGSVSLKSVSRSVPPTVLMRQTNQNIGSKRLKIPYTITPDSGGIAEVRIFHNGKLISSDGTYKDAPGKAYAPVGGKSVEANQYADAQRSGRNAGLLEPANSAAANQVGSLSSQLIVRGAPEKKCNPCKGEIEIDVIPGEENTVSVVAFNRDNTIQSVPASVTFKSTLPKEEPHLWLLSVGINQFQGITPLVNAKKDALDFACTYAGMAALTKLGLGCSEAGRAQSLFKSQNIHVVDTLLDAKATKANIQGALDKIASQAKPGDTFVWFVASHGMMDANSLFGIVAHDTTCLNDKCTDISGHITSNEILEASKKIKAMKQLMVLDTCHSGGLDSKMSGLYDARMSLLAKNMGLHMYASAQATEQAQDGVPGSNGTFTEQLLEGIKGAAPKNSDGFISVMTLGQYAKQKTIEATQAKGGANAGKAVQTPVIQHFGLDAGLVGVGAQ